MAAKPGVYSGYLTEEAELWRYEYSVLYGENGNSDKNIFNFS
jgi:hypothetical protein